jgi:IS4 transposase
VEKVNINFEGKNLTGNGGLIPIAQFAEKLKVEETLRAELSIKHKHNSKYSVVGTIMITMLGVIAGAKHISQLGIIRHDPVIMKLLNWGVFPAYNTISRLFKLFSQKHNVEFSNAQSQLRQKVWDKKSQSNVTLDIDSTVRGVYGKQEGTEKGFNSKKKGQRSYHPLLAFIAETKECLHSWFRSGAAYTGNNCAEFLKECFALMPKQIKEVLIRADSGFFCDDILSFAEGTEGVTTSYLIKVKLKNLVSLLQGKDWKADTKNSSISTTTFKHKCGSWEKSRTFVAVRMLVGIETENLFFPIPKYEYFCYVTNLDISPIEAHALYGERATSENWIEWCKNHMAAGSFLTQKFWANAAVFQACILAYNLLTWMRLLTSEVAWREEPNTFRGWFINAPGRLIRTSKQWFLKLPKNYYWQLQWEEILLNIQMLRFA